MDKILRRFGMQISNEGPEKSPVEFLIMDSYVPNDFGNVIIRSLCQLNGSRLDQVVLESSGSPLSELFNARLGELSYFLKVLPLFNPQISIDYGLQTQERQTAPQEF